jgi:hypothetical protein
MDIRLLLWQFSSLGWLGSDSKERGASVKISGYVVWVNDASFWHRTEQGAQKRVFKAELAGQDVFIHALNHGPHSPRSLGLKEKERNSGSSRRSQLS